MFGLKRYTILLLTLIAIPALAHKDYSPTRYEQTLVDSIVALKQADLDRSRSTLEALTSRHPNSKLGHLLLGDILAARIGRDGLANRFNDNPEQLAGLRDELDYRLQSATHQTPAARGMVPAELIRTAPGVRYILAADASLSRLYIFRNNGDSYKLVNDYFMTIGRKGMGKEKEGDLRTPVGVYFVTTYRDGAGLPPRYGPGAFPIDYPNAYDKKLRRTGYGIWIHGTEPENYNRVPLASDGCLSLTNDEFLDIRQYVATDGSTPVIISRKFNWVSPGQATDRSETAEKAVRQWQSDLLSLDPDRLIGHYSASEFGNLSQYTATRQSDRKFFQQVNMEFSNLSIYSYPGEEEMMLVSFDQEFHTNKHSSTVHRKQFWKQYNGRWQIFHES